jgi:integrase
VLTNALIRTALPGATLWDENCKGLHLRCTARSKHFYLHFRTKAGQERRPKLGAYPTISLDQARKIARELIVQVSLGLDPMAERQASRTAPTVSDLCDKYLTDHASTKKPRSEAEDTRQIEAYIRPKLGELKVQAVVDKDISTLHAAMKSTPYQANRVLMLLKTMLTLAEKWGWRLPSSNPCRWQKLYTERKRKRYMSGTEAPKIGALLASWEARRPESVAFIYLLVLSGARPEEIARARPEWVVPLPTGGRLDLPDSKTGAKPVYLPPQVMELLARLPKGDTLTGILSPKALWDIIRVEAGCPDLRLYDLRHTFASAALQAGYTLEQIGELLGHKNTQTTKRYAHLIDAHAQRAAADTANVLEGMMKPAPLLKLVGG